ncbi:MAG: lipopolysaccharide assembly protein LapB, partial [Gammaproteobacteria bacterium]|nr:lipopolysaccharide assembly protein LapB [Gammaproteobacteria bacterium]
MHELLWLLLPVAAASGWYAAVRSTRTVSPGATAPALRSDYFKGLNYLLNEQHDKAIEVFVRMLEVDSNTVETHLALGNLFRRRGEVDRAIRIHQNLISRSALKPDERGEVLLELGQDYMHAGLLDRAEGLFQELVEVKPFGDIALRELTDIYQQEKDWDKAVSAARRREESKNRSYGRVIAHFHCEQAELLNRKGDLDGALAVIKQALDVSSQCIRASLLEGRLLQAAGDHHAAIRAFKRVEQQDPDYIPEVVGSLRFSFGKLGRQAELEDYLNYLLERYGGITVTLALAEMAAKSKGAKEAVAFLTEQLRRRPSVRGLDRLIEMSLTHVDWPSRGYLLILKDLTDKLLENRSVYNCHHCGFTTKALHWQCPGCKYWG